MLFPLALLVPLAASAGIYFLFRSLAGGKGYWIAAAKAAGITAAVRIGLVACGAYLLENTSGWLQLPGYAMALCGLPEMLLMPGRIYGSAESMAQLAALVVAGSAAWIFALASLAARGRRGPQRHGSSPHTH